MRLAHGMLSVVVTALLAAAPRLANARAAEATVICKDGTTGNAGKGACSGHGGVDKKATKASYAPAGTASPAPAASAPTAPAAAEEMVTCKDGTTSKSGRGACRGHGGVDKTAGKAGAKPTNATNPTNPTPALAPAAPPPPLPAPAAASKVPPAQAAAPAAPSPPATSSGATAGTNPKNTDPTGAIAKCKDGTYSHAKGHTGACSRHGGVAEWLDKPAK